MENKSILHLALEKALSLLSENNIRAVETNTLKNIFDLFQSPDDCLEQPPFGYLIKDKELIEISKSIKNFLINCLCCSSSSFDMNENPYTGDGFIVDKNLRTNIEILFFKNNDTILFVTDEVREEIYLFYLYNFVEREDVISVISYIQGKYMEVKQELEKQKESLDTPTSKKIEELKYTVKSIKEHFDRRIEKLIQKIDKLSNF